MRNKAYTDGACRGNPGLGGWGVLLEQAGEVQEIKGAEAHTTNNRMELQAVIEVLQRMDSQAEIEIVTDSEYVMKGVQEWMARWKRNGWRTANRKPVANQDLWQILDELVVERQVYWQWVRGHTGVDGNERADALANEAIDEMIRR